MEEPLEPLEPLHRKWGEGWGNAIESISHHHVGVIPSPFTAAALQDEEFGGAVIHLAAGGPVKK